MKWMATLSEAAKSALQRHNCVLKSQVRAFGRDVFARDTKISKKVLLEIEAAIGTWEPPPKPAADNSGGSWNRTNPPKRGKPDKRR